MRLLPRALLAATALLLLATGTAWAAPPESRVMYRLSGTTATAEFTDGCAMVGDLQRCRAWLVTGVDDSTTHSPGEATVSNDVVCLYAETWWYQASGEPAAAQAETGCVDTDDQVVLDARELTWARILPTDVTLDLASCTPTTGWESLCDVPATRTASVSAEFEGTGDLITSRSHWRGQVPFAPRCIELDVDASRERAATAAATIDGVTVTSYFGYISYGRHAAKVTCR